MLSLLEYETRSHSDVTSHFTLSRRSMISRHSATVLWYSSETMNVRTLVLTSLWDTKHLVPNGSACLDASLEFEKCFNLFYFTVLSLTFIMKCHSLSTENLKLPNNLGRYLALLPKVYELQRLYLLSVKYRFSWWRHITLTNKTPLRAYTFQLVVTSFWALFYAQMRIYPSILDLPIFKERFHVIGGSFSYFVLGIFWAVK